MDPLSLKTLLNELRFTDSLSLLEAYDSKVDCFAKQSS